MPAGHEQSTRTAIVSAVVAFIVVNAVFYYLSGNYFDAHAGSYTPDQMTHVRGVFAITCGVIIAVNFIVGLRRHLGAHVLSALLGLSNVVGGVASFATGMPRVLAVTQLVAGALMPTLAWFSYRRSRAAWAFLVAMCGVFAVTDMFGAPRIGQTLSLNLWTTMIIPGLYAVATVALVRQRGEYGERDMVTA